MTKESTKIGRFDPPYTYLLFFFFFFKFSMAPELQFSPSWAFLNASHRSVPVGTSKHVLIMDTDQTSCSVGAMTTGGHILIHCPRCPVLCWLREFPVRCARKLCLSLRRFLFSSFSITVSSFPSCVPSMEGKIDGRLKSSIERTWAWLGR